MPLDAKTIERVANVIDLNLWTTPEMLLFVEPSVNGKAALADVIRLTVDKIQTDVVVNTQELVARRSLAYGRHVEVLCVDDLDIGSRSLESVQCVFVVDCLRTGLAGDAILAKVHRHFGHPKIVVVESPSEQAGWLPYYNEELFRNNMSPLWLSEQEALMAYHVGLAAAKYMLHA